jgi:hypothetical protein
MLRGHCLPVCLLTWCVHEGEPSQALRVSCALGTELLQNERAAVVSTDPTTRCLPGCMLTCIMQFFCSRLCIDRQALTPCLPTRCLPLCTSILSFRCFRHSVKLSARRRSWSHGPRAAPCLASTSQRESIFAHEARGHKTKGILVCCQHMSRSPLSSSGVYFRAWPRLLDCLPVCSGCFAIRRRSSRRHPML